jgi:Aspartyl/Asparaginyl beta-hydroxylase
VTAQSYNFDRWPDRLRLPLRFDPLPLQREIIALQNSNWVAHFVTDNYVGDWSALPLRAPKGASHPILQIAANPGTNDWVATPLLDACPAIATLIAKIPGPQFSARLMRLGAGAKIHRHSDPELSPEDGTVRLHMPIFTNDRVDFRLNDSRVIMGAGECWYLRLTDPHSVSNDGPTPRIHLVLDCAMTDELAQIMTISNP